MHQSATLAWVYAILRNVEPALPADQVAHLRQPHRIVRVRIVKLKDGILQAKQAERDEDEPQQRRETIGPDIRQKLPRHANPLHCPHHPIHRQPPA
ncbi:hypothetical protein [Sphingopyxis microcysteis]|uniref:hypothetical protein n=1 Tax=Sphingopyxis microcysteis TaxID=2484145 RepID=UPI001445B021|nr:hypothetical protein [Sphingopyxis microcysteis]